MSVGYRAVQWAPSKRVYDVMVLLLVVLLVGGFVVTSLLTHPRLTAETLVIRGSAVAALTLLTLILCIGPLTRLDRRFLPLLYNRRHLGVAMFLLAVAHAALATFQFHAFGDTNPLVSVFTAYARDYDPFVTQSANISRFPFEPLGAAALLILFLMAATSHDFWLHNLGTVPWKKLHLLVLVAYGLVVLHVAFGALQAERSPVYAGLLLGSTVAVYGLHLAAARREVAADRHAIAAAADGFVRVARLAELAEGRGHTAWLGDRRVALWRHQDRVFATSNVCRHQGGPLGEGHIVDGCITCPWHGWQYRPSDGHSPPPFDERVETYRVRSIESEIWVHPDADPPGTLREGVPGKGEGHHGE